MPRSSSPSPKDADAQWAGYVAEIAGAQPGLRAFVRTLLPCAGDADDVLQETNLVLWQKRSEYDPSREFGPWARRVAYFQTLAHLKTKSRSRESRFSDEMLEQLAVESEKRADSIEERLRALRTCLSKLPEEERQLVNARYATGTPVKTMAKEEGRSADAVSMHLYRLRQKLAACIEQVMQSTGLPTKGGAG